MDPIRLCAAGCSGCARDPGICAACPGCTPARTVYHLNQNETALMDELASVLYLPLGQFVLLPRGTDWEDGTLILSPVLLTTEQDSLETVMERADALVSLARMGLLSLDFGIPLSNYSYEIYYRSALFREFSDRFCAAKDGRPVLRCGSAAITQLGLDRLTDPSPGY